MQKIALGRLLQKKNLHKRENGKDERKLGGGEAAAAIKTHCTNDRSKYIY